MNAIVVVDENWAIGKDGGLLVHLPGDLRYYRQKTLGKNIIVGRKTLESFPGGKPLPERRNIVLTRDRLYSAEGCTVCHSTDEVVKLLDGADPDDIFVAGGSEIYREFFDMCGVFYVTRINASFDADRYFPDLDSLGFTVSWESELQEEKGITYRFLKYVRDNNR